MKTDGEKLGVLIFAFLGVILLIPVVAIYHGFVFSVLWHWYAVPLFGAPVITSLQAAGLLILINLPLWRLKAKQDLTTTDRIAYFVGPLLALLVGWAFSHSI